MPFEKWIYALPLRIRSLFHRAQLDSELREELQDHVEQQVRENLARGMSMTEARSAALRAIGGVAQIEEQCREKRRVNYIEDFVQDLRFGARQIRRNPGPSLLAIVCLVVGIGATASVCSWIEGILLRPFAGVAHQERLVAIEATRPGTDAKDIESGFANMSWPDWLDFQRNCTSFDAFIVSRIMGTTLSIGDRAQSVAGLVVSSNYFDALGVHPILGRGFEPAEDFGRDAHPVTVISYWLWKQRFNGDPQVIGKTQLLNNVPHTIVGVAPEEFLGTFVGYPIGFWVPVSMQEVFVPGGYKLEDRGGLWIEGYARLKPGVSIEHAQQEISLHARRLETEYLSTNRGRGVRLFPLSKTPFNQAGNLRPTLQVTLAVVLLVLLIACANVSSLLLVRSLARRHEMTVRLAVGARRVRLIRQLLTEGLILSTLAASGGLMLAYWCRNSLAVILTPGRGVSVNLNGQMDWRVFAFSSAICLLSALVFGLAPALQTSKIDLAGTLKSESATALGGRGKSRLRSSLVVAQVALTFILLVGAVLALESVRRIRKADPGFATDNVLTTSVALVSAGYDEPRAKTFQDALLGRVSAMAGVEAAAWARVRPFSYATYFSAPIATDDYHPAPDERPEADYNQVSPGYFATMQISLVSGREFTVADNENAPLVSIVNEKMVAKYWHGANPIGKRLMVNDKPTRVIGVARMAKYQTFGEEPKPFFYVPLRQYFAKAPSLIIRTALPPKVMAASLAREVAALDANLAPTEVITMRQHILRSALSTQQIAVTLLTIFGSLALLLAVIGLYGVISYAVSQSTRELALRMALGARAVDIWRLVMSHGLTLTVIGLVVGAGSAIALTRLMSTLLYKVNPRDPVAFAAAFLVMTLASLTASFLPAWRASRTGPVQVLHD